MSAFNRAVEGAIPGRPNSGRCLRNRPPRRPGAYPRAEIIALPDFGEIAVAHNLSGASLATHPDPHGFSTPVARRRCRVSVTRWRCPGVTTVAPSSCRPVVKRGSERTFRAIFPGTIPISPATT